MMTKKNNDFQQEYYSQNADTDRASHTDSAQGNTMPLVIMCFFATALFFAFGLFLFFSNVNITSMGLIESPLANKIIVLIVMLIISLFFLLLGFSDLKKAKKYNKEKNEFENDETLEDEIWRRTCPKCGKSHDVYYPECPNCKYNYLE